MEDWREKPTILKYWPEGIDYVMFVDENNHPRQMQKAQELISKNEEMPLDDRFLTVTGCVFSKAAYAAMIEEITTLKKDYWEDGCFHHQKEDCKKRVCFHSSEIRNASGAFRGIDYDAFVLDLSSFMARTDYRIFSATVDMYEHARKYSPTPKHPYSLAMEFICERFAKYYLSNRGKKGSIVFERRGDKEDRAILKHIQLMLDFGTYYVSETIMQQIDSVYFNPKRTRNHLKTYVGLEIADLTSYPIHKLCKCSRKDKAFLTIESKFHGYPDYFGKGLKVFPYKK